MDRHRFFVPLLIAVTLLAFWRAAYCQFVNYDDDVYIFHNPPVLTGLTPPNVQWAFTTFHAANYHPLTWLSLMLDSQVWGTQPSGYHLTGVLLHALGVVLLYAALYALTGSPWRSALVALIFGIHPLRVESVAWISERKDVLSGCLAFAMIWAYARYAQRPAWWRYALVAVCFGLGLLAKPSLVPLPFLLLLLDVWPLNRVLGLSLPPTQGPPCPRRAVWVLMLEKLPLLALTAVSCVMTYLAQRHEGAVRGLDQLPIIYRLANTPTAYVRYLGKMVWFRGLIVDYPYKIVPIVFVVAAAALLVVITVIAVRRWRGMPWLAVGWFWYLGMLVPVIGLVQVGAQSIADRYTYLPCIGLLMMVVWSLPDRLVRGARGRAWLTAAVLGITVVCGAFTFRQIGYWQDSAALFGHVVKFEPQNYTALVDLGLAYAYEKKDLQAGLPYLEEAVSLQPQAPLAHRALGAVLVDLHRPREALDHLNRAVELQPERTPPYMNLGLAHAQLDEFDLALDDFRHGVVAEPDNSNVYYSLAAVLVKLGRPQEALAPLREVLRRQPQFAKGEAYLGYVLLQLNRGDEAVEHLETAVRLEPGNMAYRNLLAQAVAAPERAGRATPGQP